MLTKAIPARIAKLFVGLAAAAALKVFYSTASVNDLRWILAPTATFSGLVTGMEFTFEPYAGYISDDRTFLIAASCSGMNFLIIAFLVLTLSRIFGHSERDVTWGFIPCALAIAYVAAIAANTVRVCTAMYLRRATDEIGWMSEAQFHRLEGILIYFGFLLLIFVVSDRFGSQDHRSVGVGRRLVLPLMVYYAATLGLPLAAGMYQTDGFPADFWEHFLFVLLSPLLLIFLFVAGGWIWVGLASGRGGRERKVLKL